jgi:acetyl-CoA acetyltransferase
MRADRPSTIIALTTNHPPARDRRDRAPMLNPIVRTLVKVIVASLVVGAILSHFGITAEQLMREFGLSADRIEEFAKQGFTWAWPNVLLGSLIIVPVWFLIFLFRPPGQSSSE